MDWVSFIQEIIILILPPLLAFIFGKLGIDADKVAKHNMILLIAKQTVLWAQDAFPDSPGVERYAKAYDAFVNALYKNGLLSKLSEEELEQILKSAYQEVIGIQKNLIERR